MWSVVCRRRIQPKRNADVPVFVNWNGFSNQTAYKGVFCRTDIDTSMNKSHAKNASVACNATQNNDWFAVFNPIQSIVRTVSFC